MNLRTIKRAILVLVFTASFFACEDDENAIDPKDTNIWKTFNTKNGLASNSVNSILEDSKGNVWVCTMNKGVCRYDGTSWETFNTTNGLLSNTVFAACEDINGGIWFGTSDGVNLLDNNHWFYLTGFAYPVQCLNANFNGNIMVGTFGNGLFVVDSNYDIYPIIFNGQTFNNINTIYESKSRHFWLGTDNGLVEMIPQSTKLTYKCNYFKKADGLVNDSVNSIMEDDWGTFWLGHSNARYLTKYDNVKFNTILMPVPFGVTVYSMMNTGGNLWIGTFGVGIFKYDGAFFYPITKNAGVAGNWIRCIISDKAGNIWIGAYEDGVSKYIP